MHFYFKIIRINFLNMSYIFYGLGGAYLASSALLYFFPGLIHRRHIFRETMFKNSRRYPAIVAHRGGNFYIRILLGSMEFQENTLPAFQNSVCDLE